MEDELQRQEQIIEEKLIEVKELMESEQDLKEQFTTVSSKIFIL
jgi:hypothetical protein